MWQQLDCDAAAADRRNGWGCAADLFPWVEVTIGAGSNGKARPSPFTDTSAGEGSTSMGFYNVQQGDAPYLKELHQAVNGGTGANSATSPNANYGGGSYVNCSDEKQPGVDAIRDYLGSLTRKVESRCAKDHYYLLNNYNPGYFGDLEQLCVHDSAVECAHHWRRAHRERRFLGLLRRSVEPISQR
jgi:phospholipase C